MTPTAVPATPTAVSAPVAQTISVHIVQPSASMLSWGFAPATVTIRVGDTIVWTNDGPLGHTATANDGSFDSGMLAVGGTWSYTFNTAGTYGYICTPHPWMKGTVIVQDN